MPAARPAEEIHAETARRFLAKHNDLGHLRVRRRANLIVLESGRDDDPIPHARFRRLTATRWTLECATHTSRWEQTGFDGNLEHLLELLTTTLPWTLARVL